MISKIYNKFILFLNKKDEVLEELQPSEAYISFKNAKNNNEKICEKYSIEIINIIANNIENAVDNGKFETKYVHDRYMKQLEDKHRKYIIKYFKDKGYKIFYKKRREYGKIITIFIVKWDNWL